jgi:squalene cyclase
MRATLAILLACGFLALPGGAQDSTVPALPEGITGPARKAIDEGLAFLAREQNAEGSWRTSGGYGSYPVAMTGLSALSLVASGSTPTRGPYAKNVRRATKFILSQQQHNGLFAAPAEEGRSMYGHGFGTLFLAQIYGMEEDKDKQRQIKAALTHAIALVEKSQSRDGGWLYTPDMSGD